MRQWRLGLFLLALSATGCPDVTPTSAAGAVCSKQFDKCKLPKGPLGVCQSIECAPGATAPCLKCVSQH